MVLLISCETVVDIDLPDNSDKIVVNAVINPDSLILVEVVSTISAVSTNYEYNPIDNATVQIYRDNELIEILPHRKVGFYESASHKAVPGATYRIEVESPGYQGVSAVMTMPNILNSGLTVQLDTTNQISNFEAGGEKRYDLEIEFNDPPGENYYQLIPLVTEQYEYYNSETDEIETFTQISQYGGFWNTDDPLIEEDQDYDNSFVFKDVSFEGKTKKMVLKGGLYNANNVYSITLVMRNISKSFYDYQRSKSLQFWNDGDPFAEPVPVFNNIENGYGIFAGYTEERIEIKVKNN